MDKKGEDSSKYYSILDNFASEVGSSLEDLAINWEDNQNFKNERSASGFSMDSSSSADDFGKRFAKPLFFYNPVYSMVYKDAPPKQTQRPTLIPLAQLNGNNAHTAEDEVRSRKLSDGKLAKKKSPRSQGIFSKITAAARRHSQSKSIDEGSSPVSDIPLNDDFQAITSAQNENTNVFKGEKNSPESHETENPAVSAIKKTHKMPPVKSPRNSRIITENLDLSNTSSNQENTSQDLETYPVPAPRKRDFAGQDVNLEKQSVLSNSNPNIHLSSPQRSKATTAGPPPLKQSQSIGSLSSVDSIVSDDGPPSDPDCKTMADVITEVEMEDDGNVFPVHENNEKAKESLGEFVETPGQLKRNKTLRWSGTRNAPALMREFTRKKQRKDVTAASDRDSPSKEVEKITVNKKSKTHIRPVHVDSRSCTPSQQTTSFGMGDDGDDAFSTDTLDDADASSSESSVDSPSTFTEKTPSVTLKPVAKSPTKRDSFIMLSSLLPPAPKLRRSQSSKVRAFLQKMGSNVNNALGYAVTQFLEQTLKNKEKRPLVLLHDVRSFLSDIKHYLISNPHIGLAKKIQRMVNKSSMVDVEGAVDDALDRLVLYPLHDMIYRCLVVDYNKSGQLAMMQEAIALAKRKTPKELGIRDTLIPPNDETLEEIKGHFVQLQRTYSPYFKLKELLAAVTKIYQNTKDLNVEDHSARKIGADDFLPLLVYAIVRCDFIAADIETQYIDSLLDPTLLLGEGGYYLTTLISAIQVVISIKRKEAALPNISDLQGFLKVGISPDSSSPENTEGNKTDDEVVMHKTLHVPPAMTARNLCQMIAKKFKVSLPENYCLHVVVNGVAHALEPNESPQLVKMDLLTQFSPSSFYFAFQRRDMSSKAISDVKETVRLTEDTIATAAEADDVEIRSLKSDSETTSGSSTEREIEFPREKDIEEMEQKSANESITKCKDSNEDATETDAENVEEKQIQETKKVENSDPKAITKPIKVDLIAQSDKEAVTNISERELIEIPIEIEQDKSEKELNTVEEQQIGTSEVREINLKVTHEPEVDFVEHDEPERVLNESENVEKQHHSTVDDISVKLNDSSSSESSRNVPALASPLVASDTVTFSNKNTEPANSSKNIKKGSEDVQKQESIPTITSSFESPPTISVTHRDIKQHVSQEKRVSSGLSDHSSDTSSIDDQFFLGIESRGKNYKRKSCMARENVASLTEFFETKGSRKSSSKTDSNF